MSSENVSRSNEVISNQFFYKPVSEIAPRYKYTKVYLSSPLGTIVPVTSGGVSQISYKLPFNTCFNLYKSKLVFLIPMPSSGSATVGYWSVQDAWPFGNAPISLETGNGLQLLNMPSPGHFTKVVTKVNTKLTDYLTTDVVNFPHPSNSDTNVNGLNTAQSVHYLENQYFTVSTNVDGVGQNIPVMYELGNIKHSMLDLDKTIYTGQNDLYLKITIGNVDTWAFQSASATDPTATPATLGTAIGALQNCYLYLATETNPLIIDNLIKMYDSGGIKLQIDYPICTNVQSGATNAQTVLVPYTPAMGKYLKRIYVTAWNNNQKFNTTLDNENTGTNPKVKQYRTQLDTTNLQDDIVYCSSYSPNSNTNIYEDDWRVNEPVCHDSVIFNQKLYSKNWFHCDAFDSIDLYKKPGVVAHQNLRSGIPVERGITYTFSALETNSDALIYDVYGIFVRDILINKDGIQFI